MLQLSRVTELASAYTLVFIGVDRLLVQMPILKRSKRLAFSIVLMPARKNIFISVCFGDVFKKDFVYFSLNNSAYFHLFCFIIFLFEERKNFRILENQIRLPIRFC